MGATSTSHMQQRAGGTYYFRMGVPQRFHWRMGQREVIGSLRTKEYTVAKLRCRVLSNQIEQLFRKLEHMPSLSREKIQIILRGYFQDVYKAQVDTFHPSDYPDQDDIRQDAIVLASQDAAYLDTMVSHADFGSGEEVKFAAICARNGVNWKQLEPLDRMLLTRGLREADSRVQHAFIELLMGRKPSAQYIDDPAGTYTLVNPEKKASYSQRLLDPNSLLDTSPTVRKACEQLLQANPSWREKTIAEYQRYLGRFAEFIHPETPIHTITKEHLSAFLQSLRERRKSTKSTQQRHGDELGLSAKSLNLHMDPIRMLFANAVEDDDIVKSPFKQRLHKVPMDDLDEGTPRLPYDMNKRLALFGSPSFNAPAKIRKSGDWWLPWLGLYTGARRDELSMLRTEHVIMKDGHSFIRLTDTPERKLKNTNSRREIPVHPDLIALGFMEYVSEQAAKGELLLFSDILWQRSPKGGVPAKYKNPDVEYGKYFNQHTLVDAGIKEPWLDFHSFRVTLITELEERGVAPNIANALVGHGSMDKMRSHYSKADLSGQLKEAMDKVNYGMNVLQLARPPRQRQ